MREDKVDEPTASGSSVDQKGRLFLAILLMR